MPWTKKQQKTARAVEHGWKPKGSVKGFDKEFAKLVNVESTGLKSKKKGKC